MPGPRIVTARVGEVELPSAEPGDAAGAPVVFLHAFADSWRSFERVLRSLRDRAPSLEDPVDERLSATSSLPPPRIACHARSSGR